MSIEVWNELSIVLHTPPEDRQVPLASTTMDRYTNIPKEEAPFDNVNQAGFKGPGRSGIVTIVGPFSLDQQFHPDAYTLPEQACHYLPATRPGVSYQRSWRERRYSDASGGYTERLNGRKSRRGRSKPHVRRPWTYPKCNDDR